MFVRSRFSRVVGRFLLAGMALVFVANAAGEWLRPTADKPVWGVEGGLQFAIYPGGFYPGTGGPRGLIRIGYPILPDGEYALINFIAVEPIVDGDKGFSELEPSDLDGVQGKRFWTGAKESPDGFDAGSITVLPDGTERLDVTLRVEEFHNGADVYLVLTQRSDRPDELMLTVHAEEGSAPMEMCILTATMGNQARARKLWLRDEVVSSLDIYSDYTGEHFAPHTIFPLERLHRTSDGDVLVAITTDEENPRDIRPFPGTNVWYYGGDPVTQYWRKPRAGVRDDLHVAVNARYTYWQSTSPIPGGISYENFEMRERFRDGQQFIFGITGKTPAELSFNLYDQ